MAGAGTLGLWRPTDRNNTVVAMTSTRASTRSRRLPRGQAFVEFALVLPIMLGVMGATLDLARVYQSSITLEAATRDAAEYAASVSTSATDASASARRTVCLETKDLPGHVAGGTAATCTEPIVTVTSFTRTTSGGVATTRNPIANATVVSTMPFRTLFAYPLITSDGVWTLRATATYTITQNR